MPNVDLWVQLIKPVADLKVGHVYLVHEVVPHGGYTDEPCQYRIGGEHYLLPSQVQLMTDVDPNAYWWALRWLEKATPAEIAAMKVLIANA